MNEEFVLVLENERQVWLVDGDRVMHKICDCENVEFAKRLGRLYGDAVGMPTVLRDGNAYEDIENQTRWISTR